MVRTRVELLRWQQELVWLLFEYHLERLEPDDLWWESAEVCWSVRPDGSEGWVVDWADVEPHPVPAPTVAWLVWHLGWWWSVACDQLHGRRPRAREDVVWPGDLERTVAWLRSIRADCSSALDALTDDDLERPVGFPWPEGDGMTVAHLLGWVNAELMKNVAEIGQLRLLRAAGHPSRSR